MAISNPKLKKACTDVFCGQDCLTKYAELKEVDRDLTERGFSQWMAEQHRELLEKMLQQCLSKEQMKALGENIRRKMNYAKQVVQNEPPQPTTESHNENQESTPDATTKPRPLCTCGKMCEKTHVKKDGSQGYSPKCWSCNRKKTKPIATPELPQLDNHAIEQQLIIWQEIERRLSELAEYMKQNCHVPSGINGTVKLRIINSLDTINIFLK